MLSGYQHKLEDFKVKPILGINFNWRDIDYYFNE